MSRDTRTITVEVPLWVYRSLQSAATKNGLHIAGWASHLLQIAAFLTAADINRARKRRDRVSAIRDLWMRHHSQADIARITGVHKNLVSLIVTRLNREDRIA